MRRANFLKCLLLGAMAPLTAPRTIKAEKNERWRCRQWVSHGIHFSEYVLPPTMLSVFEPEGVPFKERRKILIPVFREDQVNFDEALAGCLKAAGDEELKHCTIIRVKDRPGIAGVGLYHCRLVPVEDFYKGV